RKLLNVEKLTAALFAPRRMLRPAVPYVPKAGSVNAAVLNHICTGSTPAGRVGSPTRSPKFAPPLTRARWPEVGVNGYPLCSVTIVFNCHPFTKAPAARE